MRRGSTPHIKTCFVFNYLISCLISKTSLTQYQHLTPCSQVFMCGVNIYYFFTLAIPSEADRGTSTSYEQHIHQWTVLKKFIQYNEPVNII